MRKPISVDLRERIVAVYAEGKATREEVAKRFKVSLGVVKTLAEMKERMGLGCTVAAIHWVVTKLGLTYKKRRSMRLSKPGRMWRGPDDAGSGVKAGSTRRGWFSSTNPRPKPI